MKVSIVIPCYNCAAFIADSVRSALAQDIESKEVICIDNASTDKTWPVLQELAQEFPSLRIDQEHKPGAPAARNKGWKMAQGEWIQFLDADDLMSSKKISHQLSVASESSAIMVGDYIRHELATDHKEEVRANRDQWMGLINNRLGITSANLFRRQALVSVDGFDEGLKSSQEYDLMFRILKKDALGYADGCHTTIRSRAEGSISKTDVGGNKNRYLQLTARICLFLKASHPDVYERLGEQWYQDMFIRIRMNAIDGFKDSGQLFSDILPRGFKAEARPFTPKWFRVSMRLLGYPLSEKIRGLLS